MEHGKRKMTFHWWVQYGNIVTLKHINIVHYAKSYKPKKKGKIKSQCVIPDFKFFFSTSVNDNFLNFFKFLLPKQFFPN